MSALEAYINKKLGDEENQLLARIDRLERTIMDLVTVLEEQSKKDVFDREALADYLGVPASTCDKWRKAGILRARSIGKKIFYLKHEIIEDIENLPVNI